MPPEVQFNDENQNLYQFQSRSVMGKSQTSGMANWLIRHGWAKDEKSAGIILIVISIIAFGASIYFFSTV